MPISFTILGENIPVKQRGFFLVLIGIFYTLGELLACLIAFFTMESLTVGNWRALLALSSAPAFLVFVFSYFFIDETVRFLLVNNDLSLVHENILKIAQVNGVPPQQAEEIINVRVMLKLKTWNDRNKLFEEEIRNETTSVFSAIKELFTGSF